MNQPDPTQAWAARTRVRVTASLLILTVTGSGCSLTPPAFPEGDRVQREAERQQREAREDEQALDQERAAHERELALVSAELQEIDGGLQTALDHYHQREQAFDGHGDKLTQAQAFADACEAHEDPLAAGESGFELASYLGEFAPESRRDAALTALESCRRRLLKSARKQLTQTIKALRKTYAVDIEDSFDSNNPYSRGGLSAKVSGTQLQVRMRGNFEGRARHSQDQVDQWCAGAWGLFTKITLNNAHGQFSCVPDGSPRALSEGVLEEAKLGASWLATGEQPTPPEPGQPPALLPDQRERRATLEAERERLEAVLAGVDSERRDLLVSEAQAQQRIDQSERQRAQQREDWRAEELARARRVQTAGAVLTGIGGALLLGTVGALQLGVGSARVFPIGAGISVPLLLTGTGLLIGAGVRKSRIRKSQPQP